MVEKKRDGESDGDREAMGARFPKRDDGSVSARAGESSRMRRPKVRVVVTKRIASREDAKPAPSGTKGAMTKEAGAVVRRPRFGEPC